MKPTDDSDIEDISVVEDLDPEPAQGAAQFRVREVVVGVMLLVGVLGWAGYTSWRDQSNADNYSRAQEAASHRQWDAALAYYSLARGYKNADARATETAKQVHERDEQYAIANQAQRDRAPLVALQAARAVQTAQPGYRNVDAIAAQAEDQVYTDALSGTIVMRKEANPPGLYYRGPKGWVWLEDSDKWSTLVSSPCGNGVVYDALGPGWKPPGPGTPTPNPYEPTEGSPWMRGRRLVAAQFAGEGGLKFQNLSLDPANYNYYLCSDAGVWAARFNPRAQEIEIPKNYFGNETYVYEVFGSPITSTVALAGTNGTVVDLGKSGQHVLLAAFGRPIDGNPVRRLYIESIGRDDTRVVYSTTDIIVYAHLSPDERYILVISAHALGPVSISSGTTGTRLTAELVDTEGKTPITLVAEADLPTTLYGTGLGQQLQGQLSLSGVFLTQGAFAGKLLITWPKGDPANLRIVIIDPKDPKLVLKEASLEIAYRSYIPVYESQDGHTLILRDTGRTSEDVRPGQPPIAHFTIIKAGPGEGNASIVSSTITPYGVKLPTTQSMRNFGLGRLILKNDTFVYEVGAYPQGGNVDMTICAVPLSEAGTVGANPTQLFNASWMDAPLLLQYGLAQHWRYGATMFAYTDQPETLHIYQHRAGRDLDVSVEKGVTAIYNLDDDILAGVLQ
jgi:hypothetical protein